MGADEVGLTAIAVELAPECAVGGPGLLHLASLVVVQVFAPRTLPHHLDTETGGFPIRVYSMS